MFGMLDYRAHKLFFILFFVPGVLMLLLNLLGLPLISYLAGLSLGEQRVTQILIALVAQFIIEFLAGLVWYFYKQAQTFLFQLIVDVIPHDGRTLEEAWAVVRRGDSAILELQLNNHPSTWDDELIYKFVESRDWVTRWYYGSQIRARLTAIHEKYEHDSPTPDFDPSEADVNNIVKENNLEPGWWERMVTNVMVRRICFMYSILLVLLIYNPTFK